MRRQIRRLLGALVAAVLAGVGTDASAAPSGHPHFDDRGTLRWCSTWAEASTAAQAEGRVVFMDLGRLACPGCKTLVERVLPDARVSARLAAVAVGWSVDADHREPFADQLRARHLPRETLLPMLAFVTPSGGWISGTSGSVGVEAFLAHLQRAEAHARPHAAAPRARSPGAATPHPRAADVGHPRSAPTSGLPPPTLRRVPATGTAPLAAQPAPSVAAQPSVGDCRISCCYVHNPNFCAAPAPCAPPPCAPPPCAPPPYAEPPPAASVPDAWSAPAPVAAAPAQRPSMGPAPLERSPTPAPRATHRAPAPPPAPPALPHLTYAPAPTPPSAALPPASTPMHPLAEPRLEAALREAVLGRRREAAGQLEQVRRDFAGGAAALDAERGLLALATLDDLAQLSDPRGPLARALRANQREELRGTRWVRLFPA